MGFGAFGKIPSVGDFFRLSPPAGFTRVWDEWLQELLLAGQGAHGPYWDGYYMTAPIWRFTLSPGLAGPQKVMGVLMPSVDRVGRRFPLTLMAALPTPGPASLDHLCESKLFEQLEDVALTCLEDNMTREKLSLDLAGCLVPTQRAHAPVRGVVEGCMLMTGASNPAALPSLLAGDLLDRKIPGASLWTAVLDGVPRLMVCQGLPSGNTALGLFDLAAPIWSEARPI
ncbi:type VI secretion system-associated protein TagF [Parasedimentitalea psychrophila]|uniref:Type VI secretion system-associated protein TagF n=1 Tax=Parasedimentitalea psychrophila TaxID=2997337 RepID=A0A9Y2L4E0_9RHOB|nr:type VI secretion system-associated protein TagF [Parasedimentitalea psychrophila]WIY27760.1 type VI secretion system-associated protein TagF [Parasedimentitalea psychrophila]